MKINKLLFLILVVASIIRFWNLGNNPPHLTPDEASLGYNAYSILKTARDEYGQFLPIIFKSFGDYKPGFYIYTAIPTIAIFGLNEFSTRFPSAFSGVLAVLFVYLIVQKLKIGSEKLKYISSFLLAIMPWHIHFSRGAWEINLALTLSLFGIWAFLKSLEKEKFLIFSVISFSLTLITYQGAKLSTAIIVAILILLLYKKIQKSYSIKTILISLGIGFLISIPILLSFFNGKTGRLNVFSVLSYERPKEYLQAFLDQGGESINSLNYYMYHPEWFNFARGIMGRYFNHFSGRFLFFEGDWQNPRHSPPYQGMLLIGDLLFLPIGIFCIIRKKLTKEILFFILWLILAPLPSALSRDQVHAVRSFNMLIPLTVVISFGLDDLFNFAKVKKILSGLLISAVYLVSFIYYLDSYFVHLPAHQSKYWEYGYKQIVQSVSEIQNNYKEIKVQQSYAQPYIYFLFYQKYDPSKYQKNANLVLNDPNDVGQIHKLDNISFTHIDWSVDRGSHGNLVVADTVKMPVGDSINEKEFKLIKEIKYLNNIDIAFRLIEILPKN